MKFTNNFQSSSIKAVVDSLATFAARTARTALTLTMADHLGFFYLIFLFFERLLIRLYMFYFVGPIDLHQPRYLF